MALEITNSKVIPERNFNKIWVTEARFVQPKSDEPKYSIKITYMFYHEDENGIVFDESSAREIMVEDIEPLALAEAAEGNFLLVEGMVAFESALAKMIDHFHDEVGPISVQNNITPEE